MSLQTHPDETPKVYSDEQMLAWINDAMKQVLKEGHAVSIDGSTSWTQSDLASLESLKAQYEERIREQFTPQRVYVS